MKPKAGRAAIAAAGVGGALALFSHWRGRRAEAQVPPDGAFVAVDGARLHYTDQGEGPPVVMIHGLGGQLRNFSYALADLVARHHRVILIDRPRSGYSTAAGAEPDVAAQARIVAAGIRALGIERPLLVGHSLGGAVALALALDDPGLASGLALIAPLTQPQPEPPPAFRSMAVGTASRAGRLALAHTLAVPLAMATAPATLRAVFAPEPAPSDFAVRGGGALALRPGNIAAAMFEMRRASEEMGPLSARYGELTLPVAILYGREDQVLDHRRDGEAAARQIPRCRLELVEGGHMLPVTQPELTARFIERAATAR
ncbi:alpha/beta fold hydrolase [uncultured Sphingomonas sp.]|uniref:alpha/beta fold hydrolase n=1 Tax=uncultured Sphingomonas sp. TaxID=158754 RepID=UPI0035CA0211